jgi:hypothetical protein
MHIPTADTAVAGDSGLHIGRSIRGLKLRVVAMVFSPEGN